MSKQKQRLNEVMRASLLEHQEALEVEGRQAQEFFRQQFGLEPEMTLEEADRIDEDLAHEFAERDDSDNYLPDIDWGEHSLQKFCEESTDERIGTIHDGQLS